MTPSDDRQPGSNPGEDPGFQFEAPPDVLPPRPRSARRYPGRNRVTTRDAALEIRERQLWPTGDRVRYPCTQPYVVRGIGLPDPVQQDRRKWAAGGWLGKVPFEAYSRCRKCANCLLHRRRLWTARALDEVKASSRSWFGTLTIGPWQRVQFTYAAAAAARAAGHDHWQQMSKEFQMTYLVKAIGPEITKWLKRLRKHCDGPLRYLLVVEAHKDGFPHFHLLLHEQGSPIVKRMLEGQWKKGVSHWRLIEQGDVKQCFYVCKYLSKDALTRIRASRNYGRAHLIARSTEAILGLTRSISNGKRVPVTEERGKEADASSAVTSEKEV